MNHNLGYKIVHNPGYDFELGHKNKNEFFYYPGFKSVTCVGYTLEEQVLTVEGLLEWWKYWKIWNIIIGIHWNLS